MIRAHCPARTHAHGIEQRTRHRHSGQHSSRISLDSVRKLAQVPGCIGCDKLWIQNPVLAQSLRQATTPAGENELLIKGPHENQSSVAP
jgi:hypothetical protein